jgi:hypothetical protein
MLKAEPVGNVDPLLKELRHNPMLWLLILVPVAHADVCFLTQSGHQGILPDDCLVPSTGPTRDFYSFYAV